MMWVTEIKPAACAPLSWNPVCKAAPYCICARGHHAHTTNKDGDIAADHSSGPKQLQFL